MASSEGSPRASGKVTMKDLIEAIISAKHDVISRCESIERRIEAKIGEKNLAQEGELCEIIEPRVEPNEGDKEYLVVELVKPKPLLHTNHGTKHFT